MKGMFIVQEGMCRKVYIEQHLHCLCAVGRVVTCCVEEGAASYYLFYLDLLFTNMYLLLVQVVVYQYTKLQQMKAKAALSTTKDVEKMGGGGGGPVLLLLVPVAQAVNLHIYGRDMQALHILAGADACFHVRHSGAAAPPERGHPQQ